MALEFATALKTQPAEEEPITPSASEQQDGSLLPGMLWTGSPRKAVASADKERSIRFGAGTTTLRMIGTSLGVFFVLFIAMRHAQPTGIILYQGVVLGFFLSLAQFSFQRKRLPCLGDAAKNALLTFLLIYVFVFTIPTTVDRAYSVRMLTSLDHSRDGFTRDEIAAVFVQGFLKDGGVDKRLAEQSATGSIHIRDGRYSLTPMGRLLTEMFHTTRVLFVCQGRS